MKLEQLTISVKVDDRLIPGITRLIECAADVVTHCKGGEAPWLIDELATALSRVAEFEREGLT